MHRALYATNIMIQKVKRFIGKGKTNEAFDLIQKELIGLDFLENSEILLLQSRFNENEILYGKQLIDFDKYLLEKTRIKNTLLQLVIPELEKFLDSIEFKFGKVLDGNVVDIINFLTKSGAIKRISFPYENAILIRFQFQCDTIKSVVAQEATRFISMFQFQCGTIKSVDELPATHKFILFQFQCGTIKSHRMSIFNFKCL